MQVTLRIKHIKKYKFSYPYFKLFKSAQLCEIPVSVKLCYESGSIMIKLFFEISIHVHCIK